MKLLIFSDIHGSLPVAGHIADLIARHSPDATLLLGDILYHGPRNPLPEGYNPKAVVETLSPFADSIIALRGNCDSEVDSMVLPFPLTPEFTWILQNSPGGTIRIFATHGHIYNPQSPPPLRQGDVLLFGHTHIPKAETGVGKIHICNPGSLSLPKEGTPPCFGIFEKGIFSVYTAGEKLHIRLDCK